MQAGMTAVMTYSVTALLGNAFTVIDSAQLASIVGPDGNPVDSVDATVSSGDDTHPQVLTALFTPALAGLYSAIWKPVINGNQTLTFPVQFFVTWTNVYDRIRSLLGMTAVSLPDTRIDFEYQDVLTDIFAFAATLPPFYTFNTTFNPKGLAYSTGFDQGMAKIVAGQLRPYIGGKRPTGEVSLFKKGTTTLQYSVGTTAKSLTTLEEQWIQDGWEIMSANIPEVLTATSADRPNDMIMTRGPKALQNHHANLDANGNVIGEGRWTGNGYTGYGEFPGGEF